MGMHARPFRPFGAPVFRFAVSQGVALGFHILCLWHRTLREQLAQTEFRSNSNSDCRVPGERPSRPMDWNRMDLFGSPGFPAIAHPRAALEQSVLAVLPADNVCPIRGLEEDGYWQS